MKESCSAIFLIQNIPLKDLKSIAQNEWAK